MISRVLQTEGPRTWAVIFRSGDELASGLKSFAAENNLTAASFKGIGAFRECVLGYFDWEKRQYKKLAFQEQMEVLSLIGDIAINDGKPSVHAHVVVGRHDGTAHGGHLMQAYVRPTVEVILTESPAYLQKEYDPESGLALIRG